MMDCSFSLLAQRKRTKRKGALSLGPSDCPVLLERAGRFAGGGALFLDRFGLSCGRCGIFRVLHAFCSHFKRDMACADPGSLVPSMKTGGA
jgi:hypothetical protein